MVKVDDLLYNKLFDLSDDALLLLDEDRIIQCNPACVRILKARDEAEVMQFHSYDFSPPIQPNGEASKELAHKMISKTIREGHNRFEWVHQRFNGELFSAEVSLTAFSHQKKHLIYAVIRDLTPWLDSKKEIQDVQNRLEMIAANTEDIIWMRDLKFRYTYLSPSVKRVKGWTVEEAISLKAHEVVPPEDMKHAINILREELENEKIPGIDLKRSRRFQMREYCKDGSIIWTEQSMSFTRDHNNKPIGILGITRDISEQRKVLDELKKAKNKAEESDKLKSAFLANMSHEIRTPLNAILGFSELLADHSIDNDEKNQFTQIIKKSSNQLLTIITDIFDISKIEAEQIEISYNPVCIGSIFQSIERDFKEILATDEGRGNSLSFDPVPQSLTEAVLLDEGRVCQILQHLIGNAIKFTSKGLIRCGVQKSKDKRLHFFVSDTGQGIPKDFQKVIFERFRQADDNLSRSFGGTGLGLAICKGLLELMDGTIHVDSSPGRGSKFWFELPLQVP